MKIFEVLKEITQGVFNSNVSGCESNHLVMKNLKQALLDALIYFNRFNSKFERTDALKKSIECMDDVKILLKLAVDLKCIEYDGFKKYEDLTQQVVKMMVSELKLQFKKPFPSKEWAKDTGRQFERSEGREQKRSFPPRDDSFQKEETQD